MVDLKGGPTRILPTARGIEKNTNDRKRTFWRAFHLLFYILHLYILFLFLDKFILVKNRIQTFDGFHFSKDCLFLAAAVPPPLDCTNTWRKRRKGGGVGDSSNYPASLPLSRFFFFSSWSSSTSFFQPLLMERRHPNITTTGPFPPNPAATVTYRRKGRRCILLPFRGGGRYDCGFGVSPLSSRRRRGRRRNTNFSTSTCYHSPSLSSSSIRTSLSSTFSGRLPASSSCSSSSSGVPPMFLIGQGYDIHRLSTCSTAPLILGGVSIPADLGVVAHSDGDVVLHSLVDAIFGALGLPDIGFFFPDTDAKWKGASSSIFVEKAVEEMKKRDYRINNVDVTILLEKPKLKNYKQAIKQQTGNLLNCPYVNVKARTHEQVDATGRGEAIECHTVVLLKKASWREGADKKRTTRSRASLYRESIKQRDTDGEKDTTTTATAASI